MNRGMFRKLVLEEMSWNGDSWMAENVKEELALG
jgi:hypothetical protein